MFANRTYNNPDPTEPINPLMPRLQTRLPLVILAYRDSFIMFCLRISVRIDRKKGNNCHDGKKPRTGG